VSVAHRYSEFLAKAEEAELQAARAKDTDAKDSWLKVAAGYRDLAQMAQHQRRAGYWKL
jgi:hypothetical protein